MDENTEGHPFYEHATANIRAIEKWQREQIIAQQLDNEATKKRISDFLNTLNVADLTTVQNMIQMTAAHKENGLHLAGLISGCLVWKHGRSWDGDAPFDVPDSPEGLKLIESDSLEEMTAKSRNNYAQELKEWDLEPNPDPNYDGYLRCSKCHLLVHSLDDRKLRPKGAEGCEGCKEKAKWG